MLAEFINILDISEIDIEAELADRGLSYMRTSGNNLKAHCVVHNDSSPSMVVSLRQNKYGVWYCNGCGAKGNFFTLISYLEGITIGDAIKQFFGDVEEVDVLMRTALSMLRKKRDVKKIQYKVISKQRYEALRNPNGRCLKYLHGEKRKFTDASIEKFSLKQAGRGDYKDRFFLPYFDQHGFVRTIKARLYIEDRNRLKMLTYEGTEPKPTLYGFFDSNGKRNFESRKLILVEGECDAIWMQQNGFPAAGLGTTSISQKQMRLLAGEADYVYVMLDPDMQATPEKQATVKRLVDKISRYVPTTKVWLPKETDPNDAPPELLTQTLSEAGWEA